MVSVLRPVGRLPTYAWPGGYPMVYDTRDGMTICPDCANRSTRDRRGRWTVEEDPVVQGEIHWEGPPLICDDCGAKIESAYGDPDDERSLPR